MGFTLRSSDDEGVKYIKVLKQLRRLRDDIGSGLNLDFDEIDQFCTGYPRRVKE